MKWRNKDARIREQLWMGGEYILIESIGLQKGVELRAVQCFTKTTSI
jgi:hypothetical protein